MTTYQVHESQPLADGIGEMIRIMGNEGAVVHAAAELRSAATPGNGFRVAAVPHGPLRARLAHWARRGRPGPPGRGRAP